MQFLQNPAHHFWQPAAWLRVTGEDAFSFLQGQLTNDLKNLRPGRAVYGLWLNQKGRVVADSFVIRAAANEFFAGSYHVAAGVIKEHLEAYIVADDVVLTDETTAWCGLTFFTDAPEEAWREHLPDGFIFRGRRDTASHWEWVAPVHSARAVRAQLDARVRLDAEAMESRRILAGIPAVPADIGPKDLPNEGGLDRDAVSYTKGCYLGQEVMARLKAMGQVRRRLLRVRGTGGIPALPAVLFAGDRPVGELRSAVAQENGFAGLAMITLMHLPADAALAFAPAGTTAVVVQDKP